MAGPRPAASVSLFLSISVPRLFAAASTRSADVTVALPPSTSDNAVSAAARNPTVEPYRTTASTTASGTSAVDVIWDEGCVG